jgi:protein-S-isoprenylcysteine O-methyltransferase Ste14
MIGLALTLCVVFLITVFGWRPYLQHRRTGDHGYRGFSGSASLIERVSGLLFLVSLIVFLAAACLALAGAVPIGVLPGWLASVGVVVGVILMSAGFAMTLAAQRAMGAAWRVGVEPGERTELFRGGPFGAVRNPVFSASAVFFVGFSLVVPNVLSLGGILLGWVGIELQVRRVEEPYLRRVHGHAYAEYARTVGRFFPGVGRLE